MTVINMLSDRIFTLANIPLETELAAMKDIVIYIDLPGKSIDPRLTKEVQAVVNGTLEKVGSFYSCLNL